MDPCEDAVNTVPAHGIAVFRIVAALLSLSVTGCGDDAGRRPADPPVAVPRGTARGALAAYDLAAAPGTTLRLPPALREISGISFAGGRLFGHDDERGTVYEIDTVDGTIIRRFDLGERRLRGDFEDIAAAGDSLWIVDSRGDLYLFGEGPDGGSVPFEKIGTGLAARNDVEGLCFDPASGSLLLACKEHPGVDSARVRAIHAFDPEKRTLSPGPRFLIDLDELGRRFGVKDFRPSGIARHPATGGFFVISAVGNTILELSPAGEVLGCAGLPEKHHAQPEGLSFDGRGRLFISNEGPDRGTILIYDPVEAR